MPELAPLPQSFYARSACEVARALLGKRLVRLLDGERIAGMIVETEAYCDGGAPDLACHATANQYRPTARTAVMFGPPGHAYVYFTYGMHWMFNVVAGREGQASGVLVRALEPLEGEFFMARHRNRPRRDWTSGPAKLTKALAIDRALHGANLFDPTGVLAIEDGPPVDPARVCTGPRIGLGKTPEPWLSMPWRYWLDGNPFVSR